MYSLNTCNCTYSCQKPSVAKQAEAARINLKIIETLTYSCQNLEALITLNSNLSEKLKTEIPNSDGLLIHQKIVQRTKQSAKSKRVHKIVQQKGMGPSNCKRGLKRQIVNTETE